MNRYKKRNEYAKSEALRGLKKLLMPKPQFLPEYFDICEYIAIKDYYTWTGPRNTTFRFKFPYDVAKRNQILEDLHHLGWEVLNRRLKKGNDVIYMDHPHQYGWLELVFHMNVDGSTCKQVKIGSETVTREEDIFEVVCSEGAEESTW